jgi:hypothetical protein
MPINAMKTWVDGTVVSAADLNAEVRDAINAIDQGHQLLSTTTKNGITWPAGSMVYDTTLSRLQSYSGTAWQSPQEQTVVPAARMNTTANQSISNNTITTATGSFEFDTTGTGMSSTANGITIPTTGVYLLAWSYWWNNNTTGSRLLYLGNGSNSGMEEFYSSPGQSYTLMTGTLLKSLTAGNVIYMGVFQKSGAALAGGAYSSYLSAQFISKAS